MGVAALAFGFPAHHTQTAPVPVGTDRNAFVRSAIASLGWTVRSESDEVISATTSVNLSSWGEQIEVRLNGESGLVVTSKCSLPTQCIDWGKNKRNVRALLAALHGQGGTQ